MSEGRRTLTEAGPSTPADELRDLGPGDEHYMAFVGPPLEYDLIAATQFRLVTAFGLRADHRLLDFGCGSLRVGRLLIPYLNPSRYFGIEPNKWLVEEAIEKQVGADLLRIKQPTFLHDDSFRADLFDVKFDFILAQSIFSHTGAEVVSPCLESMARALSPGGMILANFHEAGWPAGDGNQTGWVYPDCVPFRPASVGKLAADAGLHACRLSWYHPRLRWYAMSCDQSALPGPLARKRLTDPVFQLQPVRKRVIVRARQEVGRRVRPWLRRGATG